MTHAERLSLIREWHGHTLELQQRWDEFRKLLGSPADSPLGNAVWRAADGYTQQVSARVGDDLDWLDWWHYECGLGANPQQASWTAKNGRRMTQTIRTVTQLARVIEATRSDA